MHRRKALGGIFALTGISLASFSGYQLFYANTKATRGQLKNYVALIAELVDIVIPPTNTPGAKQAKVQEYIIGYMENCSSNKEYNNFINGLEEVVYNCYHEYRIEFVACTIEQKITILDDLDNNRDLNSLLYKIDNKLRGRSFFSILKSLTVEGFCTSRLGATELLVYQPVPAQYKAITIVKPNQKAWAIG